MNFLIILTVFLFKLCTFISIRQPCMVTEKNNKNNYKDLGYFIGYENVGLLQTKVRDYNYNYNVQLKSMCSNRQISAALSAYVTLTPVLPF